MKRKKRKGEGDKHKTAKTSICNYLNSGGTIEVDTGCKENKTHKKKIIKLGNENVAKEEVRYSSSYGVAVFDVMWIQDGIVHGIEIYASHRSDSDTRSGTFWIEVRASEVLKRMSTCGNVIKLKDLRGCTECNMVGMVTDDPKYKLHLNRYTNVGLELALVAGFASIKDVSNMCPYDLVSYELMTNRRITSIVTWNSDLQSNISLETKRRLIQHNKCLSCGKSRGNKQGKASYRMLFNPLCRYCYDIKKNKPYYITSISTRRDQLTLNTQELMLALYSMKDDYSSCVGCGSKDCVMYNGMIVPGCKDCIGNKLIQENKNKV